MRGAGRRGGFSLIEVTIVVAILGVLAVLAAPSFGRAVERAWADGALADLRSIWVAQRFYRLENGRYTDLPTLVGLDLIDDPNARAPAPYSFSANPNAEGTTFTATATRTGNSSWTGGFAIDQDGRLWGAVGRDGNPEIVPGFLFSGSPP